MKLFPHLVGVFCTLLEPPKCNILRHMCFKSIPIFLTIFLCFPHRLLKGLPIVRGFVCHLCAPGTVVRNYFGLDGAGQSREKQIENLKDCEDLHGFIWIYMDPLSATDKDFHAHKGSGCEVRIDRKKQPQPAVKSLE